MSESVADSRIAAYDVLFASELDLQAEPDASSLSVTGLYRTTRTVGRIRGELAAELSELPEQIDAILPGVRETDGREADTDAPFMFTNAADRRVIVGITAEVVRRWEIAFDRSGHGRFLPDVAEDAEGYHTARALIVETAAAVVGAGVPANNFKLGESSSDRDMLTTILASRGPEFVRQWFNGTIVEQWMEAQAMTDAERAEWRALLTPNTMKHLAEVNVRDPLGALTRVREHLAVTLSDENLVAVLGWNLEEVRDIFTPSVRKRLAIESMAEPVESLRTIARNYREQLSEEAIAEYLGWDAEEVAAAFTPSMRKRFAAHNPRHPLAALNQVRINLELLGDSRAIADAIGWTVEHVEEVFKPGIRRAIAVQNIRDPLKGCQAWSNGEVVTSGGWVVSDGKLIKRDDYK